MDFADTLHLVGSDELTGFATLDNRMVKKADIIGMKQSVVYLGK